jgi:hypothetical protein
VRQTANAEEERPDLMKTMPISVSQLSMSEIDMHIMLAALPGYLN